MSQKTTPSALPERISADEVAYLTAVNAAAQQAVSTRDHYVSHLAQKYAFSEGTAIDLKTGVLERPAAAPEAPAEAPAVPEKPVSIQARRAARKHESPQEVS